MSLHAHKVCIYHHDIVEDINGGKKGLFFSDMVYHMNEAKDLYRARGF